MIKVDNKNLEYLSDVNLVLFHRNEFIAIYKGESECQLLPKNVRSTAVKQGLFTKHRYPSKQRLTDKAINIMVQNNLIIED